MSIRRQCELAKISRASVYYKPTGESEENLALMRLIDEQYLRTPFYGVPKMTHWLRKQGHAVNPKRVRRLMRVMGLEAIYPKRRLSRPAPGHRIYPYRLRELAIVRPNQVWATDITYIRLRQGFVYLVAIMDWFSRYVLAWEVSATVAYTRSWPDFFRRRCAALCEMPRLWESAKNTDSHKCLEKPRKKRSAFPHFSQRRRRGLSHINLRQWEYSLDWPIFCLKNGEPLHPRR